MKQIDGLNAGLINILVSRLRGKKGSGNFKKTIGYLNRTYQKSFTEDRSPENLKKIYKFLLNIPPKAVCRPNLWQSKHSKPPYPQVLKLKKIEPPKKVKEMPPAQKQFVKTDEFLHSWEWLKLRYRVLQKFGAVCMLCGSKEYICVDHIKPRAKYPELALEFDNLQTLCQLCNKGKGAWDETDHRPKT